MAQAISTYTLLLSNEERSELLRVLENIVIETHMENRRTDNLEYRAELRDEQRILKSLLAKVRQLGV